MKINEVVSNAVKDAVVLSKSIVTAVKDEIEVYYEAKKEEGEEFEDTVEEVVAEAKSDSKRFFAQFEDLEVKFKNLIDNNLPKFNFAKSEDFETLEKRIDVLEAKIEKLKSESAKILKEKNSEI